MCDGIVGFPRRGHTEAEKQRRENLEAEVKAIKEQLRDLQYG